MTACVSRTWEYDHIKVQRPLKLRHLGWLVLVTLHDLCKLFSELHLIKILHELMS